MAQTLDWQLCAARIEGLIPFVSEGFGELLALASIRRAWFYFDRDFPFETGLDHEGTPDSREIMLSWHGDERRLFLSWLLTKTSPAIGKAARSLMRAKAYEERLSARFVTVDVLCEKLDDCLPTTDPLSVLDEFVQSLREESVEFLETEYSQSRRIYDPTGKRTGPLHPGPRSELWAAGLAVASRPELFRLGKAPLLVPGIVSPRLFRRHPDMTISEALQMNMATVFDEIWQDVVDLHKAFNGAESSLKDLYASSRAFEAWKFAYGIGPVNRLELARALNVTPKTAYRAAQVLVERDLAELRNDRYLIAKAP